MLQQDEMLAAEIGGKVGDEADASASAVNESAEIGLRRGDNDDNTQSIEMTAVWESDEEIFAAMQTIQLQLWTYLLAVSFALVDKHSYQNPHNSSLHV